MRNVLLLFSALATISAKSNADSFVLPYDFFSNQTLSSNGLSSECTSSLFKLLLSLSKGDWGIKMIDASGKIPAGILSGNFNNIGDRAACTRISGPKMQDTYIKGRYFRASIAAKNSVFPISWAFCLPQQCEQKDLKTLIKATGASAEITEDNYTDRLVEFNAGDIVFFALISLPLILVFLGTTLEVVETVHKFKKDYEVLQILRIFSFITNTKQLFQILPPEANDKVGRRLESLDGIRFISMTWVVICHNLQSYAPKLDNTSEAMELIFTGFWSQTITNGFSSVDTFFLLSGVLVSYLTIKELERSSGRLNWFLFYFHRYVRITMVYSIIIFFVATVYRHIGASQAEMLQENEICRDYFWANLLYIGNLINIRRLCIGPSWYLDCDMQMFLISPLIIYPLWRKKWVGIGIALSLLVGSTGILIGKHLEHRDDWGSTIFGSDNENYFLENYIAPWMRIQPYILGLLLGYFLYRIQGKTNLPRLAVFAGWGVAFAVGFTTIYGLDMEQYSNGSTPLSQPLSERVAYGSLSRISWGLAVSWVIFACETGNGGLIHDFLSWEGFKPLSKLTFMVYLIHMNVIRVLRNQISFPERFNVMSISIGCTFVVSLSLGVSYIIHILLEAPSIKLVKYLMAKVLKK